MTWQPGSDNIPKPQSTLSRRTRILSRRLMHYPHRKMVLASNRDRGRPRDLSPPTPPDRRVTSPAGRGMHSATRGPLAPRHTEAVTGAAREGEGQRWAAAPPPPPRRGLARVPGQRSAHPTPAPFPIVTPPPRRPQGAAPPPAAPPRLAAFPPPAPPRPPPSAPPPAGHGR